MSGGNLFLHFFFGPCLENSAVDRRQSQRRSPLPQGSRQQYGHSYGHPTQPHQHQQHQRQHRNGRLDGGHRTLINGSNGVPSRQRMNLPPTIPESEEQRRPANDSSNGHGKRGGGSNGLRSSSTSNGSQRHNHVRHGRPPRYKQRGGFNAGEGRGTRPSYQRDDVSVISASLKETYKGYLTEDEDDLLDEQSAIRRSLKDTRRAKRKSKGGQKQQAVTLQQHITHENNKHGRSNQHSSDRSQSSNMSELEAWIEKDGNNRGGNAKDDGTDYDNVTTISKASKNPYRVLGISQSASPREIYNGYKRRMRETERRGGPERAFEDMENAYRRLRADIKRQEARKQRMLLLQQQGDGGQSARKKKGRGGRRKSVDDEEESDAKSRRDTIDARLKDHSDLVKDLFAKDNKKQRRRAVSSNSSVSSRGQVTTLQNSVLSQSQALSEMNIVPVEAGAQNVNEHNRTIQNSCFYLSLAASYLSGTGAFAEDPTSSYFLNARNSGSASVATVELEIATLPFKEKHLTMNLALQLKRAIEAAVLLVHPDWAKSGMVGEEVQAFSDFLVYALDSDSVLGHWAIAVFDESSGFVDVYRGRHYGKAYPPKKVKVRSRGGGGSVGKRGSESRYKYKYKDCDDVTRRANTLTLRYIPGHYQPLLPELTKLRHERRVDGMRPSLEDILSTLEKWNVLHVITDGRA